MTLLNLVLISLLPCLVIVAGLKDLITMTIPNWISAVLVIVFFPVAWLSGLAPMDMALHLGVAIAVLLISIGLWAGRIIGGGDAKLMAASCLWLGLTGASMFALWTGLAGGAFCLILIVARGHMRGLIPATSGWVGELLEPKGDIPYGVAIAVGVLMAFPASPIAAALIALG